MIAYVKRIVKPLDDCGIRVYVKRMIPKKEPEPAKLPEVLKKYNAVFSVSLYEGFANVEWDEKGDCVVKFFDDVGTSIGGYDVSILMSDIIKVGEFMAELNKMRLKDFEKHG